MLNKREVVKLAIEGKDVPYVPWNCSFTTEAADKLKLHYGRDDLDRVIDNHFVGLGNDIGFFRELPNNRFEDVFKVVWDRTVDKDIGNVQGCILPEPTLKGCEFPDPLDSRFFEGLQEKIAEYDDCFRVFRIGFSLYERAWTLRGMENLMMDFIIKHQITREIFI